MYAKTVLTAKGLRHKSDKVSCSCGCGSGKPDNPGNPDKPDNPDSPDSPTDPATLVPMEYLKDEDDQIFVPRTHTKAVQNAEGVVLDDMLVDYETRINNLEQGIAPAIKVADNLLTDAGSIALSARQGKYLNEHFTGILENEEGDAVSDGERLLIKEGAILGSHIAEDTIINEHLTEGCVLSDNVAESAILGRHIAEASISKSHLDEELQATISNVEDMTEWREQTDQRLEVLEAQMAEHIKTDALLLEQNKFLLNEHQKLKRLDVIASIYNATTDMNVQGSISWEDIRMSGLQINYKWRYWDEIDGKDYPPVAFRLEALIHQPRLDDTNAPVLDEDGNQVYEDTVSVLSTDKGLNNLDQTLKLRALNAGSTVKIVSTVNYCWLDWTHTYNISITE